MTSVIQPPAASDTNGPLTALLQVIADPKAATARLNEIKAANVELAKQQASLIENQRRAAELEVREARVTRREEAVAQREETASAIARDLERREREIKKIAIELKNLHAAWSPGLCAARWHWTNYILIRSPTGGRYGTWDLERNNSRIQRQNHQRFIQIPRWHGDS